MKTLASWFIKDPAYVERGRDVPRKKSATGVSLNYYKRVFKPGF